MVEFLRRLLKHPDQAIALQQDDRRLTYGQLIERLRTGAGALMELGLEPGQLVAVQIPKSVDYVVAVLACWWAGLAFMPLDPDLPVERARHALEVCQPDHILASLPRGQAVEPQNSGPLAYVILTSGSSGRPKGVEIGHAGLLPMLLDQVEAFAMGPQSRMLWLLSTQFDASLSDLGTSLLAGGCLCMPPAQVLERLPQVLQQLEISHLDIPPALLRAYQPEDFPPQLQTLIVGGEPSPPEVLRRWARRYRVLSVYGPTEATICSSLRRVGPDWDRPYLGKPIGGAHFSVHQGELWISGPTLALGYRNNPEETQRRFLLNKGTRYYCSGDLVEPTPEGDLVFLGRGDRQLKIRGHRIEAEELECHLLSQPQVVRAAVLQRGSQLVACYQGSASQEQVKSQLAQNLPGWMMPDLVQHYNELPLLSSGKVDLTQLADSLPHKPICQDSLAALQTVALLQARGQPAKLEDWLHSTPIAVPARSLEALVEPPRPARGGTSSRAHILLCGASGMLGSRWLQKLLPQYRVTCLVRRPLPHLEAEQRLGDLTGSLDLEDLEDSVDTVIFCAGQVNMLLPLEALWACNVAGVQRILEFCARGRSKTLHLASTLSLFAHSDFRGLAPENEELPRDSILYGGYTQSKWLAEYLARKSGVRLFCYRYGLLCGARGDFLQRFCQGLVSLGCYPEGSGLRFDTTPLDWAAEASFRFFERDQPATLHVAHPQGASFEDLVMTLKECGHRLEALSLDEFFAIRPQTPEQGACQLALARLHPNPTFREQNLGMDLFPMKGLAFEQERIQKLALPHPGPATQLLKTWIASCTV